MTSYPWLMMLTCPLNTELKQENSTWNSKFQHESNKSPPGFSTVFIINYYDNLNDETLQWHIGYNVNICEYIMTHLPNVSQVVCTHDIYVNLV